MKSIILTPLLVFVLIACTEPSDNQINSEPKAEPAKALDLSLPKELVSTALDSDKSSLKLEDEKQVLPDMFKSSEQEKRMSLSASPSLKPQEQLLDTPELNGATLSIEMKID